MQTSDYHAVLFTKEHCLPCTKTKDYLRTCLSERAGAVDHISVLKKENHQALIETYSITLYPTLLVVDSIGEEVGRIVGGNSVRDHLKGVLFALKAIASK